MLIKMQVGEQDRGELQVNVTDSDNAPIRDARVTISEPETAINPNSPIERLETDVSGQTQIVDLNTPPLEYSLNENNENMPIIIFKLRHRAMKRKILVMWRFCLIHYHFKMCV